MTLQNDSRAATREISLIDLLVPLARRWKLLTAGPLLVGMLSLGATYLISPTFTARTSFLPPQQQQQGAAAAALSQLGALAGLAGGAAGMRTPADQFVALMQSENVTDRLIDRFELMKVYDERFRFKTRKELAERVRISVGKKDGLISVEVDDTSPQRAADMANQFVGELRRLTNELALTEAQQRRAFFEKHLQQTKEQLTRAQQVLQASGFNPGALKAEPKAAAEGYARLRAQVTAAEVRLQTMRRALSDSSAEVQQQQALVEALRAQLAKAEVPAPAPEVSSDYVGKYREFKYYETLFEMFARQFEIARLDESREGGLVQVVDVAQVPEWKSKPKRGLVAALSLLGSFLLLALMTLVTDALKRSAGDTEAAQGLQRLRSAWRGG
jgi:uncharacterized protein involved in exopolysaccharide biosynthesis